MKTGLMITLLMTLAGCSQVSSELHPWQSHGNVFSFRVNTTEWSPLESRQLGRVAKEHIAEACRLLEEGDSVEISPDKAKQMCPKAQFDFSDPLKPFLIRGVSYGTPFYSIVKVDKKTDWVYFLQATYSGEIYIPGVPFSPAPTPIVILLKNRPQRVIAVGNVGGDGIFRGVDRRNTWNE